MHRSRVLWAAFLFGFLAFGETEPVRAEFPLRDGDVWVMAGDSITNQRLHTSYFEAFCFARYPQWKFGFRTAGVGGHTIPKTLARFDYDIAGCRPTVVSVELGMNDKSGSLPDVYIENMQTMVERIQAIDARPVIFAANPLNDGSTMARLTGPNQRLEQFAASLHKFCGERQLPYADQFHALIDVWGANKQQPDAVSMQGDPAHPGPNGQLLMAAALLQALGADGFVSSAALDASGRVIDAKGCEVTNAAATPSGVAFDRLDERLPFPLPDGVLEVLPLFPPIENLSQFLLTVKDLKEGQYRLVVDGVPLAVDLSAEQWAAGVNLTRMTHAPSLTPDAVSPIQAQSRAILQAILEKEQWVAKYRAQFQRVHVAVGDPTLLKKVLAELDEKVAEADAKIRAAARPQKRRYEIRPASPLKTLP